MAKIIKIGNSQGVRIPKPIIALAELEDQELDFVVLGSGLLITPKKKVRIGWDNKNAVSYTHLTLPTTPYV